MQLIQFFRVLKLALCFMLFLSACQNGKSPVLGDTPHQKQQNAFYSDATTSPLTKKQLRTFEGLPFFKQDSNFVVKAFLNKTNDSTFIDMATSTDRLVSQRVYATGNMVINGQQIILKIYQTRTAFESVSDNSLFLPFLDLTNGEDTYSGGRYLDLIIPQSDTLVIDFNKAYNPYCAYNKKFSCPIVPRENFIPLRVEAGVKFFEIN